MFFTGKEDTMQNIICNVYKLGCYVMELYRMS